MKIQPSSAIEKGLTAQFTKSVTPMPRQCCLTCDSDAKSTFNSIGMIMIQISRPTGRLTFAISMRPMAWNGPGSIWPRTMPTTMQRKTQTVR